MRVLWFFRWRIYETSK